MKEVVDLVQQETNIDLSEYRVPRYYDKKFPDYLMSKDKINKKVYSLKRKRLLQINNNRVQLQNNFGKCSSFSIDVLYRFTWELDNLDLSDFVPAIHFKYKFSRYLVKDGGIVYDKKQQKLLYGYKARDKNRKNATYYCFINLQDDNGIKRNIKMHHIIICTFKGGPDKDMIDPTVDHKDGNGLNNKISNLQWLPNSENNSKGHLGSKHHNSKINEEKAEDICKALKYDDISKTLYDIAVENQVSYYIVYNIYYGNKWKHISKKYLPFPKRPIGRPKKEKINNEQ